MYPVTEYSPVIGNHYLRAIGSLEKRVLILLDIEKRMTSAEMGLVGETAH